MWKKAVFVGIIVIIINIIWCTQQCDTPSQGDTPSKVDVFISNDCGLKYSDNSNADPIESDKSRFVVWHNTFAPEEDDPGTVEINFPYDSPFHVDKFTIPTNGVFVTQVRSDAEEMVFEFTIRCGSGGPGTGPKLKIGGGG